MSTTVAVHTSKMSFFVLKILHTTRAAYTQLSTYLPMAVPMYRIKYYAECAKTGLRANSWAHRVQGTYEVGWKLVKERSIFDNFNAFQKKKNQSGICLALKIE